MSDLPSTPELEKPSPSFPEKIAKSDRILLRLLLIFSIIIFVLKISVPTIPPGNAHPSENVAMQNARSIALLMFQYSIDHDGQYPQGKNTAEAFQKLIDEKYTTDPAIFYMPLPGKTKALPGQRLKPENVSWDITADVGPNDPASLPLVFLTGYKVDYAPNGAAVPLIKPHPVYGDNSTQAFLDWWNGAYQMKKFTGIAVCYKGNNAKFAYLDTSPNPDGIIPNFVPSDFVIPQGKTYHQLTPDGPLH